MPEVREGLRSPVRAGVRLDARHALFLVPFLSYVVVGAILVFGAGSVPVDTWARVGNADYVLFSRDPHLAAIGFVLSPLPTIAIMPLLPLKALWPQLVSEAFAANLSTAAFMAGAVVVLAGLLRDLRVPRVPALVIVTLFAAHPMIVYYGANGLTEAPFVLSLLLVTRYLLRWSATQTLSSLVVVGIALAIAYLTRYEALAAAVGVVAFVSASRFVRAHREPEGPDAGGVSGNNVAQLRSRARRAALPAVADAIVVGTPVAAAFLAWAAASWIVVGSPFPHLTSVYGNASQVELLRPTVEAQTGQGTGAGLGYVGAQLLALQPALVALLVAGLFVALRYREPRVLAVAAVFVPVMAFSILTFLSGATVGFLRYYIGIVPFAACLLACVFARAGRVQPTSPARWRRAVYGAAITVGLVAFAGALPTSLQAMRDINLGREESDQLRPLLGSIPATTTRSFVVATHRATAAIAADIDARAPGAGRVLLDVALGNPIVLQSKQPDQFVITSDRDFDAALANPTAFGIRYMLVPAPRGLYQIDAVNRSYPDLYETGGGIASLVTQYGNDAGSWRLYEVLNTRAASR